MIKGFFARLLPKGLTGQIILVALAGWLLVNGLLLAIYRREIGRLWREPVFRHPVLLVESDDWGPGPVEDAEVSAFAKRAFEKQGMKILTSATVSNLKKSATNVTATITVGGKSEQITVDRVISAVGIVGGWLVGVVMIGVDAGSFWSQMQGGVEWWNDLGNGVLKSLPQCKRGQDASGLIKV